VDSGWRFGLPQTAIANCLQLYRFVNLSWHCGIIAAILSRRSWHTHYLFGDAVSFLFINVAGFVNFQFGLDPTGNRWVDGNVPEIVSYLWCFGSG
jgi:hypothetical protein